MNQSKIDDLRTQTLVENSHEGRANIGGGHSL